MAWTDIDLSTVVPTSGTASYSGGVLTVNHGAYYRFAAAEPTVRADQFLVVEIVYQPISSRSQRIWGRAAGGSSTFNYLFYNVTDFDRSERIGNSVFYCFGPYSGDSTAADAVAAGQDSLLFQAWSTSNTGVADQITNIRYQYQSGPLVQRADTQVVSDEYDVPVPTVIQGQPVPNAQAVIPSSGALSSTGGDAVGMPYYVSGGSSQSPQAGLVYPLTGVSIPSQFNEYAEVRFVIVARNKTALPSRAYVEGYGNSGNTGPSPYWSSRMPVSPSTFTSGYVEYVTRPISTLTPDDLRAGRFGYSDGTGRRLSASLESAGTPVVTGDGADFDYMAFRLRLYAPPRTGRMRILADPTASTLDERWRFLK